MVLVARSTSTAIAQSGTESVGVSSGVWNTKSFTGKYSENYRVILRRSGRLHSGAERLESIESRNRESEGVKQ